MIAIDLDGTLLTDEKNIYKKNLNTLDELIKKGYEIVIATGRNYYSARQLTAKMNNHITYLANNGNIARHSENNRDIFCKLLDEDSYKVILEEGEARGLDPIIHVDYFHEGYDVILNTKSAYMEYYKNHVKGKKHRYKAIENYFDPCIDKILAIVYPGDQKVLKEFNSYIKNKFPNKFNTH